mmetsp:Transcript_28794/g.82443  ORF Transcript_28794/g.82443 Transcript_28794/m.82443 type:complete len:82 (-) Transcript_28794:1025-1270(-)
MCWGRVLDRSPCPWLMEAELEALEATLEVAVDSSVEGRVAVAVNPLSDNSMGFDERADRSNGCLERSWASSRPRQSSSRSK